MSMYNALFGVNPYAGALLGALGVKLQTIPRFRDCFLNEDATEIVIHTRTGGSNREDYIDGIAALRALPGFIADDDDTFDLTYANFRYAIPDALKDLIPLIKNEGATCNPAKRWKAMLGKLKEGDTTDPDVRRAVEVGRGIFEKITPDLKSKS